VNFFSRKYWAFYIHGEFKFSLGVDGEITETVKFPAPGPFEAVVFDEWGTISISYLNKIHYENIPLSSNLTSDGISANFS
jgi:hypothetical protein